MMISYQELVRTFLKKIQTFNGKIKFRQFEGGLLDKLCMLDRDGFIYGQNLRLCTEARYVCPVQQIIDTPLLRATQPVSYVCSRF